MNDTDVYLRQMDILSPRQMEDQRITLIGCGGIGSAVGLMLAKLGFRSFQLYDADTIEPHNLPNQMFPLLTTMGGGDGDWVSTIGLHKAEVLSWEMMGFNHSMLAIPHVEPYADQPLSGIVISAVDNMAVRKTIWEKVKVNSDVSLYIDARMGAQVGLVYTIKPGDAESVRFFENVALYSDADAIQLPCTNRAILYNIFMIAALTGRQLRNHLRGLDAPKELICDLETLTLVRGDAHE